MKPRLKRRENLMTFKRLLMPMLVLGMLLTLSSMAFGQASTVNCALSAPQGASAHGVATGHTEPVGAGATEIPSSPGGGTVRITCINTSSTTPATPGVVVLTVGFGVPITNTTAHPAAGQGIRVSAGTGNFDTTVNVGISSVNNSAGTVVIGLGTPLTTSATNPSAGITFAVSSTSTFDLQGVLLSLNGKTGNLAASLAATGGVNITTASLEVITSVTPGLADPTVPTGTLPSVVTSIPTSSPLTAIAGGAAVLTSSGGGTKTNFTVRIQEAYASVFKESSQFNGGAVFPLSPASDTQVNIVFANIPSGFDISNCSATLTDTNGAAAPGGSPSASQNTVSAGAPIITINFNTAVDQAVIDVLWVTCAKVTVGSATLPLPTTPITAQVTLGPIGAALSAGTGNPPLTGLTTGQIPRYQQLLQPTTPLTVVIFPAANTVLLQNFAFVGPGYNTGIAVANTTTDPFGPSSGGAPSSEGTVSFLLVKNDGTTKTYTTTTGSPGSGLTGAGVVKSGSTYVVNLSELLSAASFGTTFTGYVFITANFINAHGAGTIYITSTGAAALSSPVVVLPSISSAAPRASPESLGQ
jgi:hypothetical protein